LFNRGGGAAGRCAARTGHRAQPICTGVSFQQ
jgi:hypothetical protein